MFQYTRLRERIPIDVVNVREWIEKGNVAVNGYCVHLNNEGKPLMTAHPYTMTFTADTLEELLEKIKVVFEINETC